MADESANAAAEAARAALDLSISASTTGLSVSLKIDNTILAGIATVGVLSLGAYYLANRRPVEDAIRNGLENRNEAGMVDPEVRNIEEGSIYVDLDCHSEHSFLQFVEDFEAKKVKQRLEKELKKVGFQPNLDVTIRNPQDVYQKVKEIRRSNRSQKIAGMEEIHKDILLNCHVTLLENLEPRKVCPHLIQATVLTLDEKEIIKGLDRRGQCEELLAILHKKGPDAYGEFVKALEKEQAFLACFLLRKENEKYQNELKAKDKFLKEKHAELSAAEAKCRGLVNQLQEELSAAEAKCQGLENQLQKAMNKSQDTKASGKKRRVGQKMLPPLRKSATVSMKLTGEQQELEEWMKLFATKKLESFPLTSQSALADFFNYLSGGLDAHLLSKTKSSLNLTVHCRSLTILERIWDDYCSGHLNKVAEECLATDEVKKETGVDNINLKTTISEEDYMECKQFLTELSDFNNCEEKTTVEMESLKFKNILLKFHELLLEHLDPKIISLELIKVGVLKLHDKEKVKEKRTRKDKNEQLLMILATKGPRAYEEFVKALELKDHCFLACKLLREEKEDLLYEVMEREWQLKEAMDEEERAKNANKKLKAQLDMEKTRLLEEQRKRDEQLKEMKNEVVAEIKKEIIFAMEKKIGDSVQETRRSERFQETEMSPSIEFFRRNGNTNGKETLCTLPIVSRSPPQVIPQLPEPSTSHGTPVVPPQPPEQPSTSQVTSVCEHEQAENAELRNKVLTLEQIVSIKEVVRSSWFELGRALKIEEATLRDIEADYISDGDRTCAVFLEWKDKERDDATVGRIEDALNQRKDLAELADKFSAICYTDEQPEQSRETPDDHEAMLSLLEEVSKLSIQVNKSKKHWRGKENEESNAFEFVEKCKKMNQELREILKVQSGDTETDDKGEMEDTPLQDNSDKLKEDLPFETSGVPEGREQPRRQRLDQKKTPSLETALKLHEEVKKLKIQASEQDEEKSKSRKDIEQVNELKQLIQKCKSMNQDFERRVKAHCSSSQKVDDGQESNDKSKKHLFIRAFNYQSDFDEEGVIYHLGKIPGPVSGWENPAGSRTSRTGMAVKRSSGFIGKAEDLLEYYITTPSCTSSEINSWWGIDFGVKYSMVLKTYTLRHGRPDGQNVLTNWKIEGKLEGPLDSDDNWTLLKEHRDEVWDSRSIPAPFMTKTWHIEDEKGPFRYFRIKISSKGTNKIYLCGMELYGDLFETLED